MKTRLISTLIVASAVAWQVSPAHATQCLRSPEYAATLEFLKNHSKMAEIGLPQRTLEDFARRVSDGCAGAADRFIRVTSKLAYSGMSFREAAESSVEFGQNSDLATDTFLAIFEGSFSAEYLDLDLRSAIGLAHSLSTGFEGDLLAARADYEKLLNFCVGGKSIDLPKNKCAVFALRVTQLGSRWTSSVASPFIEVFKFLKADSGAKLPHQEALMIAEDLISQGPVTPGSFIRAFEYAVNKQGGLGMKVHEAIAFARRMAAQNRAFAPFSSEKPELHSQLD